MTKRTSAKYKIDRRMGENIWGRAKSPVNRREYGPGQHGQRRKGKLSDFGIQLRAKQKLKGYYGDIREKQFRGIFAEDATELLLGQVAVVALELLLGAELQTEVRELALAALAVLAGAVFTAVHRGFGAAPDVFAHTAVELVLGRGAFGHRLISF